MTNQEIAVFLEDTRVKLQAAIDEKFRPKYRNNTWLKQKDLSITEKVMMQIIDELNDEFTVTKLARTIAISNKCVRDNLVKLIEKRLVQKVGNTYRFKAVSIV